MERSERVMYLTATSVLVFTIWGGGGGLSSICLAFGARVVFHCFSAGCNSYIPVYYIQINILLYICCFSEGCKYM